MACQAQNVFHDLIQTYAGDAVIGWVNDLERNSRLGPVFIFSVKV
jgi:hypothetical protein